MKSFQNIIVRCLLMCITILNYHPSSGTLTHPFSQLMPLSNVEEPILTSVRQLTNVKGEIVSFERVREKTFTKVPAVIPTNASLISKHWNLSSDGSSEELILYKQNVEGGGCKIRYQDDPQGCVTCFHAHTCPAGWSYHTYKNCGFLHWGCRSICKQEYDCPTPAPTTSPTPYPTLFPTPYPTLFPTKYPTLTPTASPTFAPFTIPKETERTKTISEYTGEFYLINEFTGQVIEQAISDSHPRPGRFECSSIEDDPQGCVTCFHDDKCPTGSTYKTYRMCGFLHWGCQSECVRHTDCEDPFELLFMDWIVSSRDEEKKDIKAHPQLWHYSDDHKHIITSVNDWVIQVNKDYQIVAAPATDSTYGLSYDPVSQNIAVGDNPPQFLCVGSNKKLALCEDPDSEESRWIFKTPEEAFPREYFEHSKYYIASKQNDVIVEQTYTQKGYPLTTWIPDGSSGQLWFSDSYGRILNDDGYIMEAVDLVAIKYIIPDIAIGENFVVSSPNHPDIPVVMTKELYDYRGTADYYLTNISPDNSQGLVSTSIEKDEAFVGKQQWDLKGGQLVNGLHNRKLAIHDDKNYADETPIGVECGLEDETTDEFYLVPEAMVVSWIDLVASKKLGMSYAREEVFFYQKVAAFHMDSIIGMSPEELLARSHHLHRLISHGVGGLRNASKDLAISKIVTSSVDIVGSVFSIIGGFMVGAANPITAALALPVLALGTGLSGVSNILSDTLVKAKQGDVEAQQQLVELLLYEIQASVVAGLNSLGSFLTDYAAAVKRLTEYNETPEGQAELQAIEEQGTLFAHEIGYESWEVMYRDVNTPATKAYDYFTQKAKKHGVTKFFKKFLLYKDLFTLIHGKGLEKVLFEGLKHGDKYMKIFKVGTTLLKAAWIFLQTGNVVVESIKLHNNDKVGQQLLNGVDAIVNETSRMYSTLNAYNGDVEDLRALEAMVPASEMFFTNDELNDKWRTLTDMGNGELDNPVYGKLNDVNWYPGCDNIPCAKID